MAINPFYRETCVYGRDLDVMGNCMDTYAKYISLMRNVPLEKARGFITKWFGEKPVVQPLLRVMRRVYRGDKKLTTIGYLDYLKWVTKNGNIMTPNMVCYSNPLVHKSYQSDFIDYNKDQRSIIKKRGQVAEMEGNKQIAEFCMRGQGNKKFFNNSMSGAGSSKFNSLYNYSAHTSLTSTCRAVTSYSNALIEKFLASNRHYYTPEIAKANLAFIADRTDLEAIKLAMDTYNLFYPSVDFVYDQIIASCSQYWRGEKEFASIRTMIENMTPLERVAVSYVGDLNALITTNDAAIRGLYDKLLARPEQPHADPKSVYKRADDDIMSLVNLMTTDYMAGETVYKFEKDGNPMYAKHAALVDQTMRVFDDYDILIKAFFSVMHLPTNIHSYPMSIRHVVVASDTDSSIYTTHAQSVWHQGSDGSSAAHVGAAAITSYITSQLIGHSLAILSSQLGVVADRLYELTMKPEYYMPVLATLGTKHYISTMAAKEGNVFKEPKLDVKGVGLKSSKVPQIVSDVGDLYFKKLLMYIDEGKKFHPKEVMSIPCKLEYLIQHNIMDGQTDYFRYANIKHPDAYKDAMRSDYIYADLWNSVFAIKYGQLEEMPAQCIKVNVDLPNPKAIGRLGCLITR